MKNIRLISGTLVLAFILAHLFNHLMSIYGADEHIETMDAFRKVYRNPFVEIPLLLSILIQCFLMVKDFRKCRLNTNDGFEKLKIWSGLYLVIFISIHLGAVFTARLFFGIDTNFYFGVMGINTVPANVFFIPYYGMAVMSLFCYAAALCVAKMNAKLSVTIARKMGWIILLTGLFFTVFLFYGLTNRFNGVILPSQLISHTKNHSSCI